LDHFGLYPGRFEAVLGNFRAVLGCTEDISGHIVTFQGPFRALLESFGSSFDPGIETALKEPKTAQNDLAAAPNDLKFPETTSKQPETAPKSRV
jgi:hypothetical protein